jgi:hypothetical protein
LTVRLTDSEIPIRIDGSAKVKEIGQKLKSAFEKTSKKTIAEIETNGNDRSIIDLLAGTIDIAAIDRPLTFREKQQGLTAIPVGPSAYFVYEQPANKNARAFLDFLASEPGKEIIAIARSNSDVSSKKPSPIASPSPSKNPKTIARSTPDTEKKKPAQIASPSPSKQPKTIAIAKRNKALRGIYLSRYQVTNNADEYTIRERVRFYHDRGFNTIVHGVWGNGCTMYSSEVSERILGYRSCPNQFNERWLDWLLDEAHRHGMEVHAYFEKGIKIDKNSPIFDRAIARKWLVPGVDRTYAGIEHYVLDVEVPEIAELFTEIAGEFTRKYPSIDAVQWDDYLGYHAELPGKVDRSEHLTAFVKRMIASSRKANPLVSFDISHHNPYWAKRYFAADWLKWGVDRVFIQAYNEKNYREELAYARQYSGIAITDRQLNHLQSLVKNPKIKSIFVFPFSGDPEDVATLASRKWKPSASPS